ncbi:unnamed protein product, partial [Timema podura]|nr:unnamed protein product [Timema podura]
MLPGLLANKCRTPVRHQCSPQTLTSVRQCRSESVKLKANLETIKETVDILEESIVCSSQAQSQHVYETTLIKLGNVELVQQLDKERRINKNLKDMFSLQASPTTKWHDEISNRCTCDTESQKKVQELTGALKERGRQMRRMKREMKTMQQQIDKLSQKVAARDEAIASLGDKLKHLEEVKTKQVDDLRNKLRSSQSSCDLTLRILEQNCHSVEEHMKEELSRTRNPARAQLIEEIRRCNQLTYENVALRHKVMKSPYPYVRNRKMSRHSPFSHLFYVIFYAL